VEVIHSEGKTEKSIPSLHLNEVRDFKTGIYQYRRFHSICISDTDLAEVKRGSRKDYPK